MKRRAKRWRLGWLIFVLPLALGCAELPGILGPVDDALGVLCETKVALAPAREALREGDVGAAIDHLKAYLIEHGYDHEVAALLMILEEQVAKVTRIG